MNGINLAQAEAVIDAALAAGLERKTRPLAIVVTDAGGHVKAFKKQDGASNLRLEMAVGKTCASLALGRASSLVRQRAEERPLFMDYLIRASDGKIFPEGGAVLIRSIDGEVIGAVGVTGDTQETDEELAIVGVAAAGLKTD
jgi:uncharacterized protein GlcG (DUF336 family)